MKKSVEQVMYCAKDILAIYIRSKVIVPCTFSTGDTSRQDIQEALKQYAKHGSSIIYDRFVNRSNTPVLRHFCQYLMIPFCPIRIAEVTDHEV